MIYTAVERSIIMDRGYGKAVMGFWQTMHVLGQREPSRVLIACSIACGDGLQSMRLEIVDA